MRKQNFIGCIIILILVTLILSLCSCQENSHKYDMLFSDITTVSMHSEPYLRTHQYVGISQGKITYVGDSSPMEGATRTYDGKNKILMPGLVNSHTHISMTALRGYADGYDLNTWLNDYIFPAEAKMDARAVKAGALLGIAEALASGTTSFTDMYFLEDAVAQAVAETGINGNLSESCTAFGEEYSWETAPSVLATKALVDTWHGYDDGRIQIDAAIHGEYTSSEKLWAPMAEYGKEKGLNVHLHLSETLSEHEESKVRNGGLTPAAVFEKNGVFDLPVTAAHCVYVSEEDMEIMAKHDITAVNNPVSNAKLASGIAPVTKIMGKGVNVALGTDGASSNNSLDMFEEMKFAALAQSVNTLNPSALSAADVITMATLNGAKAQGRKDVGKIEENAYADLIVLDFSKPHLIPSYDVLSNIVFAAQGSDVCLTMVRGNTLYEDETFLTIDMNALKKEIEEYVVPLISNDLA